MTELSRPEAPGYWQASDGNWYPPSDSPPAAPPDQKRPVIAIGLTILFLLFIAANVLRVMGDHDTSPLTDTAAPRTTVSTVAPRTTVSVELSTAALDNTWLQMTQSQQVDLCTQLAAQGRAATTEALVSGAESQLNSDAVVTWLDGVEAQCPSLRAGG